MLFSLTVFLTVLTVTSSEDTHTTLRGGALTEGRVWPSSLQVYVAVAVRKKGL